MAAPGGVVQDAGYGPIDWVDRAPSEGWSERGRVELLYGHSYIVRTVDGYYARLFVEDVGGGRVRLSWAVQLDRYNRELSTPPPTGNVEPAGLKKEMS